MAQGRSVWTSPNPQLDQERVRRQVGRLHPGERLQRLSGLKPTFQRMFQKARAFGMEYTFSFQVKTVQLFGTFSANLFVEINHRAILMISTESTTTSITSIKCSKVNTDFPRCSLFCYKRTTDEEVKILVLRLLK